MKVRFYPTAKKQFRAAIAYIWRDDPRAALAFRQKAEKSLRRLEDYPDSGRKLPEFPELPYREVIVTPYRFFYRVEGQFVYVVAVWHGAQIPESPEKA